MPSAFRDFLIVGNAVLSVPQKPSPLGKVANNRLFATDCLTDEVAVQGKYPLAFRRIRTAVTSSDLTWQSLRSATFPKGEGQGDRVMNA